MEVPNTKWTFVRFFNIELKAVLDRQTLLDMGPLPDWLCNLAPRRVSRMVSLDTFDNNLCLWHCIPVNQGVRPDRCTQAARELAKSFFKLRTMPNIPKTSLDELDKGRF